MATLRVITERDEVDRLVPAWKRLIAGNDTATVFQTPEWTLGWWRACAKDSVPFCVALFEKERLVGWAPLHIETRLGARVLRFMGTPWDESGRALAEAAYAEMFAEAFAAALREHAGAWDVLRLAEITEENALLTRACEQMSGGLQVRDLSSSAAPVVRLPESWAAYWKRLGPRHRKTLKRAARRLATRGATRFQVITTAEALARELGVFFRARLENWRARRRLHRMAAFQRRPGYYETLSAICLQLAAGGHVWLARLDVNGQPASWDLGFRVNRVFSDYMTTFDVTMARCSPGHLVLQEILRHAIAEGIERFELGPGAQPYKFWFRATAQTNRHVALYWKRPRSYAYLGQEMARAGTLHMMRLLHRDEGSAPAALRTV